MMWIWKTDWLEMHNSCVLIFRMWRGLCIYNFTSLGGGLDDSWWLSPAGSSGDSMRRWEHRGPGQKAGSVNTQRGTVLLWNWSWSLKADVASNYKLFMEYQLYFTCLHQFLYYYFFKLCFTLCMFSKEMDFSFPLTCCHGESRYLCWVDGGIFLMMLMHELDSELVDLPVNTGSEIENSELDNRDFRFWHKVCVFLFVSFSACCHL